MDSAVLYPSGAVVSVRTYLPAFSPFTRVLKFSTDLKVTESVVALKPDAVAPFWVAVTLLKSNVLPSAFVIVRVAPASSLLFAASTLLMFTSKTFALSNAVTMFLEPSRVTVSVDEPVTLPFSTVNVIAVISS